MLLWLLPDYQYYVLLIIGFLKKAGGTACIGMGPWFTQLVPTLTLKTIFLVLTDDHLHTWMQNIIFVIKHDKSRYKKKMVKNTKDRTAETLPSSISHMSATASPPARWILLSSLGPLCSVVGHGKEGGWEGWCGKMSESSLSLQWRRSRFLLRSCTHALTASFSFLSPSSCQVRRSS